MLHTILNIVLRNSLEDLWAKWVAARREYPRRARLVAVAGLAVFGVALFTAAEAGFRRFWASRIRDRVRIYSESLGNERNKCAAGFQMLSTEEACPAVCRSSSTTPLRKCEYRCDAENFCRGYVNDGQYSIAGRIEELSVPVANPPDNMLAEAHSVIGVYLPAEGARRAYRVPVRIESRRPPGDRCIESCGNIAACQSLHCYEKLPWSEGGDNQYFTQYRVIDTEVIYERGAWRIDRQRSHIIGYYPHGLDGKN